MHLRILARIRSHLYMSLFLTVLVAAQNKPPYTPTDLILLNCGSSSKQTSPDGRNWDEDTLSKFATTGTQNSSSSIASTTSDQDPSVPQIPFLTARLFLSNFTYAFPVSAGPKFLRLYFHPAAYSGRDKTLSFFSVHANGYTLMSNFSAFLAVSATNPPLSWFMKEFVIDSGDDQQLMITFVPSSGSFAFVNGIEVVSMPDDLYLPGQDHDGYKFIGADTLFSFPSASSLETVYRLNIGGSDVSPRDDTGMFRRWQQDQNYTFTPGTIPNAPRVKIKYTEATPPYTAPETVYQTSRTMAGDDPKINLNYNLSWYFPVDSGFNYLVRLHFCETQVEITKANQRLFYVYINNQTAEKDADVIAMSGGNGIPVYQDYVVLISNKNKGKEDLWLALHPNADLNPKPEYYDAILNGAEIFKLSNSEGSLAGPNPELEMVPPPPPLRSPERRKSKSFMVAVMAATFGSVFLISFLICFFLIRTRKRATEYGSSKARSSWVPFSVKSESTTTSSLPSDLCRHFSIAEIRAATHDFDEKFIIGSGGFGNVYKGHINLDGESIAVAVKRSNASSRQGVNEFETEIKMLSKLRHLHLVALIGYCDDHHEMILVYEYMPRGTLRDHLYKTQNQPLTWRRRLEICVGAARGLQYLHTGAKDLIIHRDVKTTNILLDEKWVAKVSDFGLSKVGPTSDMESHVSTVVKGSIGYVDPEYCRRQQLTEYSDVYSFGVVLFEVLCGRPAMVLGLQQKERISLAVWGPKCNRAGTLHQIVDPNLNGQIAPECLRQYGGLAERCVANNGTDRPKMSDVVWALEFTLQLQDTADKNINGGCGLDVLGPSPLGPRGGIVNEDGNSSCSWGEKSSSMSNTTLTGNGESGSSMLMSANVFSELMDPTAR